MATRCRPRSHGESGAELVEMAVTLPLILVILLAIVDFGSLFREYEIIHNGAREGVRLAARPDTTDADVQARVIAYLQGAGLSPAGNPTVAVTPTTISLNGGTWQARQVDVSYTHTYLFLGAFASWFDADLTSVPLNAQAMMRLEVGVSGLP